MGRDRGYSISDGYGDETINLNPSSIGYKYWNMLESWGKGLRKQYPYSPALLPCLDTTKKG